MEQQHAGDRCAPQAVERGHVAQQGRAVSVLAPVAHGSTGGVGGRLDGEDGVRDRERRPGVDRGHRSIDAPRIGAVSHPTPRPGGQATAAADASAAEGQRGSSRSRFQCRDTEVIHWSSPIGTMENRLMVR